MKKLLLTAALTTLCTLTVAEDTSAEMGLDIRMIDSNSDGVVSVEESALYEQLSASFSQLDLDQDGFLTEIELEVLDADEDGILRYEEVMLLTVHSEDQIIQVPSSN